MRNSIRPAAILLVLSATGWITVGHPAGAANVQYNTLALSGATGSAMGLGPNLGSGVNFNAFGQPVLNSSGQVAFHGILAGAGVDFTNDVGIFSNVGGTLAVIAREGPAGPGPNLGAGVNFTSLTEPVLNSAGEIAFSGGLSSTGADGTFDSGFFSTAGGVLATVARENIAGPGPNIGPGVFFSSGFGVWPVFNSGGKLAFTGRLTGSGVGTSNDEGVFTNASGTLLVIARDGSAGPGPNLGSTAIFNDNSGNTFSQPVINASNVVAFKAAVVDSAAFPSNSNGIFVNTGGPSLAIARTGNSGPGPNLGAGVIFGQLGQPDINALGAVAFSSNLFGTGITNTNDAALFKNASGINLLIAREGPDGPGPNLGAGVNFASFNSPTLNAAGAVAFSGLVSGTGVDATNDRGIFTHTSGTIVAVARSGSTGPGPDVGAGVNFSLFLGDPFINSAGDVAFVANLTGTGVTAANDQGIWATSGGMLTKIAREGDLFDVDPGAGVNLRTIAAVGFFTNAGGQDGRQMAFNDAGVLTFTLGFTDNSIAVVTALVPEPETQTVVLLAAAATLRYRRRY